ncbi:MAG: hypothetical protein COB20_12185 [SAR86 cluster bacterium]|uniref:Autotransporter domain-containing protein n=1 Tax=SAR86 cluster bacterium TaxID=2030880 RepID=A0A2A4WZU3_9GAMM|nr:MAG: hypothetical protein COB20_12185 [SAR86 cluster bacterium]
MNIYAGIIGFPTIFVIWLVTDHIEYKESRVNIGNNIHIAVFLLVGISPYSYAAEVEQDLNLFVVRSTNELNRANEINLNLDYANDIYGVSLGVFEFGGGSIDLIALTGEVNAEYTGIPKTLDVDSNSFGVQFQFGSNGWYLRSVVSVAFSDYKSVKSILDPIDPSNDQIIIGNYEGDQSAAYLELGYTFEAANFQVTPHLSWYGSQYEQDGYREHGNMGGGTVQKFQEEKNNRLTLGVSFNQEMALDDDSFLVFHQSIQRSREREKLAPNGSFFRQMPMAGFSFLAWTEGLQPTSSLPDRNSVEYEFGVSFLPAPETTIGVSYSGLSNKDLDMDYWMVNIGFSF